MTYFHHFFRTIDGVLTKKIILSNNWQNLQQQFPPKKPSPLNPEFALFTVAVKFCKCYPTVESKPVIILVQDDDDDDIE